MRTQEMNLIRDSETMGCDKQLTEKGEISVYTSLHIHSVCSQRNRNCVVNGTIRETKLNKKKLRSSWYLLSLQMSAAACSLWITYSLTTLLRSCKWLPDQPKSCFICRYSKTKTQKRRVCVNVFAPLQRPPSHSLHSSLVKYLTFGLHTLEQKSIHHLVSNA